ncbi:unnamed protein product [Cylicocyclus nassatus]|uniref:Uncharacterized protein n=1 Tax=Cylicocyclus nassatus TaxID=53992 RepID=A0AA36GDE4_CYLNA|nr:unnamed protein product [Cylicocyclus nassatus]
MADQELDGKTTYEITEKCTCTTAVDTYPVCTMKKKSTKMKKNFEDQDFIAHLLYLF